MQKLHYILLPLFGALILYGFLYFRGMVINTVNAIYDNSAYFNYDQGRRYEASQIRQYIEKNKLELKCEPNKELKSYLPLLDN